ncbi:hypothetical protein BFJ71_g13778, partial [Fusarium oxysporum]
MRFSLIPTVALAAFNGFAVANPVPDVEARQATGLQAAMKAAGKQYFGTALTVRNDQGEINIINNKNEIGSITPENAMKWEAIQPNRGQFNWGPADQHAAAATSRGYELRCH